MKSLFLLAAIVMPITNGCKGGIPDCTYELINPYQDTCEDSQILYCGVAYRNCKGVVSVEGG